MARLHITHHEDGTRVEVTLSRRNLLALLHKLDMEDSARTLTNNDTWEDGFGTEDSVVLVLRCEDDDEHYASRPHGAGLMCRETERYVRENGGTPGKAIGYSTRVLIIP